MSTPASAHPARRLIDVAQADPTAFRARVAALLADHADDPLGRVHVRWALGVALRELGEHHAAGEELRAARQEAVDADAPSLAGIVGSSLALALLHSGDAEAALAETEAATRVLTGGDAARNGLQHGLILQRLGRHAAALAVYADALPGLHASGDQIAEGRLLSNRGVLRAYLGDLAGAHDDLERSVALGTRLELGRPTALRLQNLGFVAGRQGRIPVALELLERADRLLDELGDAAARAMLDVDRAELLADAGLLEEAIERAEAAARTLDDDPVNGGEALLLVARLRAMAGHARAVDVAERLVQRFRDEGRDAWSLHARALSLTARLAAERGREPAADRDVPGAVTVVEVAALADDLERAGWRAESLAARVAAARHASIAGQPEVAGELLEGVRRAGRDAPALTRAQHWHATALLRSAEGDRRGARRAIGVGLDVLEHDRLAFGSAELRAHATRHAIDLVELAVRMALEDGRPAEALRALDRVRATDVAARPLPPDDPAAADELVRLRWLVDEERRARGDQRDVAALVAERVQLERRLRDRARGADASTSDGVRRLDVAALRRSLGGRTLVAYLQLDGWLHALEVGPRTTRHHQLAALAEVRTDVAFIRAAVRRLAYGRGSAASLDAASRSLDRSAADLRVRLGFDRFDPAGLVVVPSGALDGLPWSTLAVGPEEVPTLVPAAARWLAASGDHDPDGQVLLVAGPDLPGAQDEVEAIAALRPNCQVLRGPAASTTAVVEQFGQATTAHIAAHGCFRADNPLFSSLRLADGELTVYELERLGRVPTQVVLSSCEAAETTTVGGDAVLGLSTVLLRLGVSNVIAPVVQIPDAATTPVMVELHRRLALGHAPDRALGATLAATAADDLAERAVRAAFVVIGR